MMKKFKEWQQVILAPSLLREIFLLSCTRNGSAERDLEIVLAIHNLLSGTGRFVAGHDNNIGGLRLLEKWRVNKKG